MKPKVLIFAGYGLNCDSETKYAFDRAGAEADIVHINDVVGNKKKILKYQILVFQGGFSYGDDTGSGNAYANKVKNHLWVELLEFVQRDRLIIGICNGFQILVNLGLVPASDNRYGHREVALIHNNSARYHVRWVDLKVENRSPWLRGIDKISLPVAHGEGKFFAPEKILDMLSERKQVALRYVRGKMCHYLDLEPNPNGSLGDIAGITDRTGRIFGLMPHPERAQFPHQFPDWPFFKEKFHREGKDIPVRGFGCAIFENGVTYFS